MCSIMWMSRNIGVMRSGDTVLKRREDRRVTARNGVFPLLPSHTSGSRIILAGLQKIASARRSLYC